LFFIAYVERERERKKREEERKFYPFFFKSVFETLNGMVEFLFFLKRLERERKARKRVVSAPNQKHTQ